MTDLLSHHDALLCDLDGTLYAGRAVVPGAVEAIAGATARGVRTAYVTNNAARSPAEVAEHLFELGFPAVPDDVVSSSQAAAAMLAAQLPPGATVLVVGTAALAAELTKVGLAVTDRADGAVAVVQGHSPDPGWRQLAEAAIALLAGASWVATNPDVTLPSERGLVPGNGSMVAALRTATGLEPQMAGKPAPGLMIESARRLGASRPLMIGDRLATDIAGGRAADMPTLLVLTGASGASELLVAPPRYRPDYVGADMSALTRTPDELAPGPRPGGHVERSGADGSGSGELVLAGGGDPLDALRALCGVCWSDGSVGPEVTVRADGVEAERALDALRLTGAA